MEERIAELEIRLTFQDKTIEELNGVLVSQQEQIDRLERDLRELREQTRNLPFLANAPGDEAPPPHY